jgi:hypothetical protein
MSLKRRERLTAKDDQGLTVQWEPSGKSGVVSLTALINGQPVYNDQINIKREKARLAFVERLREKCPAIEDDQAVRVEDELQRIASAPVTPKADSGDPLADPAELLAKMPKAVRVAAQGMLADPNLMDRIATDVRSLGVAGEDQLVATLYMIGVSRLLLEPLATIVQGPTSSGKSYILKKVARLFPPESVLFATQITPQALFYLPPGSLVHRLIVVGERKRAQNDENADATRALREMLSEGRLSKVLPVKIDGQIQTKIIEQDGPIAYMESTTLNKLFAEDANRCILLTTDERPKQTRRIIRSLAATYAGEGTINVKEIIDRHHALQRMLKPYTVVVPYAGELGKRINESRCEARRAFPQIISLVQASTLLHQRQRQVDDQGRLLATADDYEIARRLLSVPMARQLGERVSDGATRFIERLHEWFAHQHFSAREATRHEQQSRSSVYGWIRELHDAGLIEQVEAQSGKEGARWRLAAASADADCNVLPTARSVCTLVPAGNLETRPKLRCRLEL